MAMYTGNAPAITPEQVGDLVVQPTLDAATVAEVTTVVPTSSHEYRVPLVTADPVAEWVAEGDEINASDATITETLVRPAKLAALTIVSRELAEDSSPSATEVVGAGLARDLARKLDAAFFTDVAEPAPRGLATLTGVTTVEAGTLTDLDPFAEALSEAERYGAEITSFVVGPDLALAVQRLKAGTGSNAPLLGLDATAGTARQILGVPLHVNSSVPDHTAWGIPADRVQLVLREDTTLDIDRSVYFTSDRVAIRATLRAGFAFVHPAALVRIDFTDDEA